MIFSHSTRAYEFAEWLKMRPIANLSTPENITGPNWRDKVAGRTGIIYFFGYWQQEGDSPNNLSGGHIDLWNGERVTNNGFIGMAGNFLRFTANRPHWANLSDYGKSKQILFWSLK
jgi:hypothetical protein